MALSALKVRPMDSPMDRKHLNSLELLWRKKPLLELGSERVWHVLFACDTVGVSVRHVEHSNCHWICSFHGRCRIAFNLWRLTVTNLWRGASTNLLEIFYPSKFKHIRHIPHTHTHADVKSPHSPWPVRRIGNFLHEAFRTGKGRIGL